MAFNIPVTVHSQTPLSLCSACGKHTNVFALAFQPWANDRPQELTDDVQYSFGNYSIDTSYRICWECALAAFKVKP